MASDSESSTADLSKIRKDYLKLSKAKLTKKCKALKLDAYGNKAELVDLLMKEHRKQLSPKKSSNSAKKSNHTSLPTPKPNKRPSKHIGNKLKLPKSPLTPSPLSHAPNLRKIKTSSPINIKLKNDRSKSHDPSIPKISKSSSSQPRKSTNLHRRGRSKSINIDIINSNDQKLKNRSKNKQKIGLNSKHEKPVKIKKRRSSVSMIPINSKKALLKLSKSDLIKQCKLQNININGLRNRNEMIDKLTNIEELFKKQKELELQKKKNKKNIKKKPQYKMQISISPDRSSPNKRNGKNKKKERIRPKSAKLRVKKKDISRSKSHEVMVPQSARNNIMDNKDGTVFTFNNDKNTKISINTPLAPLQDIEDVKSEEFDIISDLEEEQENGVTEQDLLHFVDKSCDFDECVSRQRLIMGLKYYEENYNDAGNNDKMLKYFVSEYKYLLSDWHHILYVHLDGKISESCRNFNLLYEDVKKYHLMCDIMECSHYTKNNRDREAEHDGNGVDEAKRKDSGGSSDYDHYNDDIDLNNQFLMDLLDNIHVYLVHSFDTGFRMRNYKQFGKGVEKKEDGDDEKWLWFDEEMEGFAGYYENKRKELRNVRGVKRMRNNKYFTRLDC